MPNHQKRRKASRVADLRLFLSESLQRLSRSKNIHEELLR
jgi:hypothetical protein